jgi:hypothetical protein
MADPKKSRVLVTLRPRLEKEDKHRVFPKGFRYFEFVSTIGPSIASDKLLAKIR